jgi:hypothetical protein
VNRSTTVRESENVARKVLYSEVVKKEILPLNENNIIQILSCCHLECKRELKMEAGALTLK